MSDQPEIVIIGAGPAGLTAAYQLVEAGDHVDGPRGRHVVGGISRTAERDGWRFDIGGHRFFTKVQAGRGPLVRDPRPRGLPPPAAHEPHPLRRQALRLPARPDERAAQPRLRRGGAVHGARTCGCGSRPPKDQTTLEGFTRRRFGWRLYRTLLQDLHREGVGRRRDRRSRPTSARSASRTCRSSAAVIEGFKPKKLRIRRDKSKQVTSLIEEFNYPKYGPGMMWERCPEIVTERGSQGPVRVER